MDADFGYQIKRVVKLRVHEKLQI